jgi:hypothetical protein
VFQFVRFWPPRFAPSQPAQQRPLGHTSRTATWAFAFDIRAPFSQIEGDGKRAFHYFMSPNSEAKFMVGAWNNREGRTPDQFKRWLMTNIGGYDEVTYRPRGRSWFVLSGYRGDDIYYEKVMFSCGGQVVNVMAVTYPSGERNLYNPVVERMEDSFKPARSCS